MKFVILVEHGIKVNWDVMVFNNLYNKLRDLSTSTKLEASRDNIKFGATQVVDILLQNWVLVDPTFIISNLEEEDENVAKTEQETQAPRNSKIPRNFLQRAPIDLDEEMEDIKEIGGTRTPLETS